MLQGRQEPVALALAGIGGALKDKGCYNAALRLLRMRRLSKANARLLFVP